MRRAATRWILVALAALVSTAATAQTAQPLTAADLNSWLDGYIPYALRSGDYAGIGVVVVRGNEVLAQRGWGFADVQSERPVDPERTLFRTGSVGKLFTWTAVMQLVEQGKLDLDADVNQYLDFKLPSPQKVTMRHLMTHTPGYEERIKHLETDDPQRLVKLEDYVKRWAPAQIYAPGSTIAYCNYGVTLAGYIVQRLTGVPYDTYIEQNVFAPLGMTRSASSQPVPAQFTPDLSSGYRRASQPAQPFENFGVGPAGGHSTTVADMARFMRAYLGGGQLDNAAILKPATVERMWTPTYAAMKQLPAMGLGFFRDDRNGRVVYGHAGDSQYFHASLQMVPEDKIGFYFVTNSTGRDPAAGALRGAVFHDFMDRYFPDAAAPPPTEATAAAHAQAIAGRYWSSRRASSNFMSLLSLLGEMTVVPMPDGTIAVSALPGLNGEPKRWRETAPFVWREVGGTSRIAARVEDGRVAAFATDDHPLADVGLRAPPALSASWNLPLVLFSLAVLALTLLVRPVRAVLRRRARAPFPLQGRAALRHRLVGASALVGLLFVGGFFFVVLQIGNGLSVFDSGLDPVLRVLQLFGLLAIAGAGVALWNLRESFRAPGWWRRAGALVFTIACLDIVWVGFAYKLLRVSLEY
ncbi:serine hydrolase domain-containing protein [Roseiterribacter gracilis]|uniref:Beta-lactamase-related domain-containing protein n=1 Tax=Roseiterribacter gracilis TaxID=2812848 RepID=A0A8S8X9X4_9PROT|nr:hypothetical protein TMPK1_03640 [Rhodospirillales bacterium TMPK1]